VQSCAQVENRGRIFIATPFDMEIDNLGFVEESVLHAIQKRRSIREFSDLAVSQEDLMAIAEAGVWAPSGKNNQPWRFVLITDDKVRHEIGSLTLYSHIIYSCRALIAVYLDAEAMYDPIKDYMSAGAAIQNMLLTVESLGLGAVWLGQILKNKKQVSTVLGIENRYNLMAVLAIGHPLHRNQKSHRKDMVDFIIKKFGG
jgi:nitroreductase